MSRAAADPRLFCILALAAAAPAYADGWAGPQVSEVVSASRDRFVRIIPGDNMGAVVGFGGSAKGKNATAEYYARHCRNRDRSALVNPADPPVTPAPCALTPSPT